MNADSLVRKQLVALLTARQAHMMIEDAVANFPMERINELPPQVTYSPWALLEHIRRTQWDILDFIRNPNYKTLSWPQDYWPAQGKIATADDWDKTLAGYQADLQELVTIVNDPATDLYSDLAHAPGYTILREIQVVADHTAYHVGEFAILRQVMGTWPADRAG